MSSNYNSPHLFSTANCTTWISVLIFECKTMQSSSSFNLAQEACRKSKLRGQFQHKWNKSLKAKTHSDFIDLQVHLGKTLEMVAIKTKKAT